MVINKSVVKIGSDFSGVGAFDQALIKLGINYETIFACDMDKYARQTFVHNYGEPNYYPENVYDREIPNESLDIYMTSPPCQAFSLAGKRKGESDKRGILFYNSHEFIQKNKPRYFIFENVKGLLSDDNGKTFQRWIDFLAGKSVNGNPVIFPHEESVPYHVYYKVLNSKNYGVPQNRERIFIIGIRDDEDNFFSFPKPYHLTKRLKDVLEENVSEKYYLSDTLLNWIDKHRAKRDSSNKYPLKGNDISACMTARYGKNGAEDPYVLQDVIVQENKEINNSKKLNKSQQEKFDNLNVDENISGCLTEAIGRAGSSDEYMSMVKKNALLTGRIRRLTPRECFRLMDFPDTFDFSVVSNTQAYKQAGNSIVVNVLCEIIKKLNL